MQFSGDYYGRERTHAANAILYEHMAGTDLSVQNQYLQITREAQPDDGKLGSHDPFGVFLGEWSVEEKTERATQFDASMMSLPELPVEIWNAIIDLATFIPGAYSTGDYSAMAAYMFDSRGICARARFETSMKDLLSISLVSKRFNAMVQQFLFKHLRITSGAHACAVLDALRNGGDIGKRTIRIDLVLEGNHAWNKNHTMAMASIFHCCPNLVSFSTSFCDPDPWAYSLPRLIESLSKHRHFKRVEVKAEKDVLRSIEKFLKDLEVLWLLPCQKTMAPCGDDRYSLPRLRALIAADHCAAEVWNIDAPDLRACIIQQNDISTVPCIRPESIEYLAFIDVRRIIPTLSVWTSLRTLSFKYEELANRKIYWPRALRHPTLECIVIEDLSYDFLHAASIEYLGENMKSIIDPDIFPNVRCIRIHLSFSKDKLPESETNIRWEWLRCCLERGIQVEMLQGSMERSGNQWRRMSRDRMEDILFTGGLPSLEEMISELY